jgi:CopG family transcriptional regulator, nickel-responsive regulator
MQRFTISLDDALASQFDAFIESRGYSNRSEAVRDLIRAELDTEQVQALRAAWCVATINYVYDHHDRTVTQKVLSLQHDHHDLVVTSLHTHLDHDHCLETVVVRGLTKSVTQFAQMLIALRGVRHGTLQLVPLNKAGHSHTHEHEKSASSHVHLKPIS